MFWRSKPKPQPDDAFQKRLTDFFGDGEKAESTDPEKKLSEALSEYQAQYYEKVKQGPR